jgi:hypothetical protein
MFEMDPNLTTPIILNATFNGTLNQPSQNLFSNPSLLAILGVVVGWLLNYFTSMSQENKKSKTETLQQKKQLYSKFKGVTLLVPQLCYNQNRLLISYLGSTNYEDKKYYRELLDASELKVARAFKDLSELIGSIQVSFSPRLSLDKAIVKLYSAMSEYNSIYEGIQYEFNNRTGRWTFPTESKFKTEWEIIEDNDREIKHIVKVIITLMKAIGVYLMEEISLTEKTNNKIGIKLFSH